RQQRIEHPAIVSATVAQPVLDALRIVAARRLREAAAYGALVLRVHVLEPVRARLRADQALPLTAREFAAAVGVEQAQPRRARIAQSVEERFGFLQRAHPRVALADILHDELHCALGRRFERARAHLPLELAPVASLEARAEAPPPGLLFRQCLGRFDD